jgi:hypothetical protein
MVGAVAVGQFILLQYQLHQHRTLQDCGGRWIQVRAVCASVLQVARGAN